MTLLRQIRCGGLKLTAIGVFNLFRMIRISSKIDNVHSQLANHPHWYLACLGTGSQFQGRGHASALIKNFLRYESKGHPCYLETFFAANVSYYENLGFRLLAAKDIPGTALTLYAMSHS
jgi:ribosomal protein S18 acetylase RimI-like enzyme